MASSSYTTFAIGLVFRRCILYVQPNSISIRRQGLKLAFAVTFSLPKATFAIIVISQLDYRYFKEIAGTSMWSLDFVLAKRGEKEPIAESSSSMLYSRSINLEMDLDAGEYTVYVSL